jgi:hypothetical protein
MAAERLSMRQTREIFADYLVLRRLLRAWENETVKLIEAEADDS